MKNLLSTLLLITLCLHTLYAQVAINTTKTPADPSAILDISSTTKGALVPRMTSAQRMAIKNPAAGLLVFDTDEKTLYMFDSQFWLGFAGLSNSQRPVSNYNYGPDTNQDTTAAGYSVSMWDQFVAIGAPYRKTNGMITGAVYIYKNVADKWEYFTTLIPTGNMQGANFGTSVSIRGNYLIVGAPKQFNALDVQTGSVYIYNFTNNAWVQTQNIYGTTGGTNFGLVVSINQFGTYIAVSEPGATVSGLINTGVVKVYNKPNKTFALQATIQDPSPVAGEMFGEAMAMSPIGNHIAVGAPSKMIGDNYASGYIGQFDRNGDTWPQTHTSTPIPQEGLGLGKNVDITDGHIIFTSAKTKEIVYLTLGWSGFTFNYTEDIHSVAIDPVTDFYTVFSGPSIYYSGGGSNTTKTKTLAADNIPTLPNVMSVYNKNYVIGIAQAINLEKPIKGAFYFSKFNQ